MLIKLTLTPCLLLSLRPRPDSFKTKKLYKNEELTAVTVFGMELDKGSVLGAVEGFGREEWVGIKRMLCSEEHRKAVSVETPSTV